MGFFKILLLPISVLYGLVVSFRNWLFNKKILKSTSFPLPIISVGNLTTGGTGKTPHVEYLIRLLNEKYKIATLSRGYGRKTKGFLLGDKNSSSEHLGDEPMQYLQKFENIKVTVGEKRVLAVEELLKIEPGTEVILLDDAFQHRAIKPGLSILLTQYSRIFANNQLLPTGTLREGIKGMKRADIIVITKTPSILSPLERRRIISDIKPFEHQKVYFSCIKYGEFLPTWPVTKPLTISKDFYFERKYSILLVTGIANPTLLQTYLEERTKEVKLIRFPDHYQFKPGDLEKIEKTFNEIRNPNKIIITTEKDWMRFRNPELIETVQRLKMFYIPIEVKFHDQDGEKFNKQVLEFVEKNKLN